MASFWQGFEKQANVAKEAGLLTGTARFLGKLSPSAIGRRVGTAERKLRVKKKLFDREYRRASKGLPESRLGTKEFKIKPEPPKPPKKKPEAATPEPSMKKRLLTGGALLGGGAALGAGSALMSNDQHQGY